MRIGFTAAIAGSGSGPGTPGAVRNVTATAAVSSEIVVTWNEPISDGGDLITVYEVQLSDNGGLSWSDANDLVNFAGPSMTVTGLTTGLSYIFRVRAANSYGYGPYSQESASVVASDAPSSGAVAASDSTLTPSVATTGATTQTFGTAYPVTFSSSGTWTNPYPAGATTGTATLSGTTTLGTLDYVYGTTNGGPYGSSSSTGSLTGLSRNTTHYARARGTNSSCRASVGSTVNPNGLSTVVTFEYGPSSGVYTSSVVASQSPLTGTTSQSVSATITSLTAGTWYIRLKAVNSFGTTYSTEKSITVAATTALGSQVSFTPPAVTSVSNLLIVGGGAGGSNEGGGGGGAAAYAASSLSIGSSSTHSIVVGGGGGVEANGGSSSAFGNTGPAGSSLGFSVDGGTSGNGNAGGFGYASFIDGTTIGGGGGGAGGVGGSYFTTSMFYAGSGGSGTTTYSVSYGGGGGGGAYANGGTNNPGAGGSGGGGAGAAVNGTAGNGSANTGGGGGGTVIRSFPQIGTAGNGGSGYVRFTYNGPA